MHIHSSKKSIISLPKPDFQKIPQNKNILWKIATLLLGTILLYNGILVIYKTYSKRKKIKNTIVSATSATATTKSTKNSKKVTAYKEEALSEDKIFKNSKNNKKIIENIDSVQQCLTEETKNPRLFIQPGTYQELHAPAGIYHLVVVSHLSKKQAMHSVQKLIKDKQGVYLIIPRNGEKYYRVTIGHSKTQYEAEQKLIQLSPLYKNLFVLRY